MRTLTIALCLAAGGASAQLSFTRPFFTAAIVRSAGTAVYTTNYVTNTWSFAVAELADQGYSTIGLSVGAGILAFGATGNNINNVEVGLTNNNTHTWQTWGVPSTGTVVGVCLADWYGAIRRTNKLTGIGWRLAVLNAQSNAVHSSTWIYATNPATPWTTNLDALAQLSTSNAWIDVPYATNQDSSAQMRLQFVLGGTNGSSSVLWTNVFDDIKLGIKYYGTAYQ